MELKDTGRRRESRYPGFVKEGARVSRREGVWYLIRMRTIESGEEEGNGNFRENSVSGMFEATLYGLCEAVEVVLCSPG